MISVEFSAGKD